MESVKKNGRHDICEIARIAVIARDNGFDGEALDGFLTILSLHPENAPAHFECARLYKKKGQDWLSVEHIDTAIIWDGTNLDYVIFKSALLHGLKRDDEAQATVKRFVEKNPHNATAHCVLGYYLNVCGHYGEAESHCYKALNINSDHIGAHHNLAVILYHQNHFHKSIKKFEDALQLDPGNQEFLTYLGMIHLLLGNFEKGWLYYQMRIHCDGMVKRSLSAPLWQGQSLRGKIIFIYSEQGFGDTFQFARYLSILSERHGAITLFEVQAELFPLFTTYPGINTLISRGDAVSHFDYHCSLLSLAAVLKTDLSTIPDVVSGLSVHTALISHWRREFIALGSGRKIGFVWAGSPLHENDHNRTCDLGFFPPLWELPGIWWFSLQKGKAAQALDPYIVNRPNVFNLDPAINSFMDTAAIILNMDLVITVDTAVAHLAASLGKIVYLLLPVTPDWRWLLEREDTPWYPGMVLFRQGRREGWGDVFVALKRELTRKGQG
jgi:tetratricopeptide (TPR) repeat protein